MADSRTRAGKTEDEAGGFCSARKQASTQGKKKQPTMIWICQRDIGTSSKSFRWPKLKQFEQISK